MERRLLAERPVYADQQQHDSGAGSPPRSCVCAASQGLPPQTFEGNDECSGNVTTVTITGGYNSGTQAGSADSDIRPRR